MVRYPTNYSVDVSIDLLHFLSVVSFAFENSLLFNALYLEELEDLGDDDDVNL